MSNKLELVFSTVTPLPKLKMIGINANQYYNLFDERESGSSQILCSYLTTESGFRYDTKNLRHLAAPETSETKAVC